MTMDRLLDLFDKTCCVEVIVQSLPRQSPLKPHNNTKRSGTILLLQVLVVMDLILCLPKALDLGQKVSAE